ncbi:QOR, partial [Symbiodinium pilosum]
MPDGTSKIDYMKKLGADEVINYKEADWADALAGKEYDQIFDCVGEAEDWAKAAKVLKKGGLFVSIANFGDAKSTEDHFF